MTEPRGASVLLDTTLGPIVMDLFTRRSPNASHNFLSLVASGFYADDVFHNVQRDGFVAAGNGLPFGGEGSTHIFADTQPQGFLPEGIGRPFEVRFGTVLMATNTAGRHGSSFLISTSDTRMLRAGATMTVLGVVAEGDDTLRRMNAAITAPSGQPLRRIRIRAAHVLHDMDGKKLLPVPLPPRTVVETDTVYLSSEDDDDNDGEESSAVAERMALRQMRKQEYVLQLLGEIPMGAEGLTAPDNVLFVCKLNPFTLDADLSQFFAQFGKILSCEILRDQNTKQSLQYAFIEFETVEGCRSAYSRADNVLLDDRRIHVDFSQSVRHLWKKEKQASREDPKRAKTQK